MKKMVKTAADRVSITLLIVSLILLLIVLLGYLYGWAPTDDFWGIVSSIFVGLATNLIGIIITVSFVQKIIDRQNIEEEQNEEIKKILRYHKIMSILIDRYTLFFQCVTSRIEDRNKYAINGDLLRDFAFSDMADLYGISTVLSVELLKPSIELFYEAEHTLCDYAIEMTKNIDFKYNEKIEKVLMDFVNISKKMDVSGVIINNQKTRAGNSINSEEASDYIKRDEEFNWVEKYLKGELKSHLMSPYVTLFFLLKTEGKLICEYKKLVNKIS